MPTPKRPRRGKRRPAPKAYLLNPAYAPSVVNDRKLALAAQRMFEVVGVTESRRLIKEKKHSSGLYHFMYVKVASKKVAFSPKYVPWLKLRGATYIGRAISSALGLYRTLCLFPGAHVVYPNSLPGDTLYAVYLRHVTTGQTLCITEWRGSFRYLTTFDSPRKAPEAFRRDIVRLMNIILDPKCPHPYEDLAAGSVS